MKVTNTPDPACSTPGTVEALQAVWETLAQDDPLWAILSSSEKKGGKWDVAEFFRTGIVEIEDLIKKLNYHEIAFEADAALDFGCGIGRLTQALAGYFRSVYGVDVAPTMVARAREQNKDPSKCRYFLNPKEDLALFEDEQFSFIYSNIVLQHIPTDLTRRYLAEFVRVLRPDGLLIFQLPARFIREVELPPAAFNAEINCRNERLRLPANARAPISVAVENLSPHPWKHNQPFAIKLGNHWLAADGSLLTRDDGRTLLPDDVPPQGQIDLILEVTTPSTEGKYLLELDLVQEGVAWFGDKGSKTTRVDATIKRPEALVSSTFSSADLGEPNLKPVEQSRNAQHFAMNCIARAEILDLLYRSGCKLELIEPSGSGGRGTMSYLYFARKCCSRLSGC